jgi:hypothetical protein
VLRQEDELPPTWQNVITYRQIDAKMIQMMKLGCAF